MAEQTPTRGPARGYSLPPAQAGGGEEQRIEDIKDIQGLKELITLQFNLEKIGASEEDVETWILEGGGPAGVQGVIDKWRSDEQADEQEELDQGSLEEAASKTVLGQPLSESETEQVTAATSDEWAAALEAAIAQQDDGVNIDWVYNELQMRPGSLDSEEAMVALWKHMAELGVVDPEEELTDAEKASKVKEILNRAGGNQAVQMAVVEWGTDTGNYMPEERTGGVLNSDIATMMESGLSRARAIMVGQLADQYGFTPGELATVWGNQGETEFRGPEAARVGASVMTKPSIFTTAEEYKKGLDMYDQSRVLAAVHVNDPELARQLKEDPWSLDSGELNRALNYVGGEAAPEGDPQVQWLRTRLAGGYRASAEVDSEQVRDAVQVLADSWNLTGAEGVAAGIARQMIGEAVSRAKASLPNPFGPMGEPVQVREAVQDLGAHTKAQLRTTPEYQELFRFLAPGEAEEEYVGRFERRSQSVLGDDVVSAVRAGMRSGNVNTLYQQGLHTEVGDSSTRFQEILARNASVFREML